MPDEQNQSFGNVPQSSEAFGRMPNASEPFRNVPNPAESFRTVPKASERKENHILTVREVARMFEVAGVARTERSIVNWCQPNSTGVARLDAYLDPNEGKYFITPQSAEAAIKEEQAKFAKTAPSSEPFRNVPPTAEEPGSGRREEHKFGGEGVEDLRFKLRESELASKVKDQYITRLEAQHEKMMEQVIDYSRTIGQLETKLLQLEAPRAPSDEPRRVPIVSEREVKVSENSVR